MPTTEQVLEVLGVPAGVGLGGALAWLLVQWLRGGGELRLRRRATQLLGDDQVPGLLETVQEHGEQLAAHGAHLEAIRAQLEPDHGGSLHDIAVETRALLREQGRRLDDHIATPHTPPWVGSGR